MRIELFPQAKTGLTGMCDRLGMTQVAATSRIIEWFTSQSDVVQGPSSACIRRKSGRMSRKSF